MRRLVLWDIDGTLLQAGDPLHRQAFELAMPEVCGVPATLEGLVLAGMLDRQIARAALARHSVTVDELLVPVLECMTGHYVRLLGSASRADAVLPGVLPALRAIDGRHAVLTGNARGVARRRLAAAGLAPWLCDGAFGDEADDRGTLVGMAVDRHPGHDDIVVVGDTPRDVEAALANGCRVVAVATGHFTEAELRDAGAAVTLPDLGDLERAVAAISG